MKQHRKEQREAMNKEERQVVALEEISDRLEEIRVQLVLMGNAIGQVARKP